ncbi:sulfatase-like hydrolase/transferase, partial [Ketobacter sp.]
MPISDRAWLRPCMLLLLCILCCSHAVAADRPNIVFILVDDVGWGEVFPEKPTTQVALPALSSLASQGIRFNDAHTSAAKCAPSRYSILTGNYQWRGLRSWGQWN